MSEEQQQSSMHTEGVVSDYFVIETHVLSTRSANAYKAVDRSRNAPICLWMLRFPLAVNSDAVKRYLERMRTIDQVDPAPTDMLAYGVDAQGVAFALYPPLDGHICTAGNIEAAEAERRFMSCLQMVARLHESRVVCGDLCASSFWTKRDGSIRFLGTMGSFDVEAAATAMAPPVDTLPYLAPEQRAGSVGPASDVFALGVLGYYLFTRSYPYGEGMELLASPFDNSRVKQVSELIHSPPVWVNEVLFRCIDPDPTARYQSAREVLNAISEVKERAYAQDSVPVVSKPAVSPASLLQSEEKQDTFHAPQVVESSADSSTGRSLRRLITVLVLLVGVGLGGYVGILLFGEEEKKVNRLHQELSYHLEAVTDQKLKDAINVISIEKANISEKQAKLESVVKSDDPLAHEILVKSASEAESENMRALSEQAIIRRARRLGLLRSAEQVRQWLRTVQGAVPPADYVPLLRCLDKTLPLKDRSVALRRAYASNPRVALRLAVALAMDLDQVDEYQPLIAQLVGDSLAIEDADKYSTLSLVLAQTDLALVFGEDVIQRRDQIPDGDILWLLGILANRNDINVRAIASMAVDRGLLPPVRAVFLGIIRDRGDLRTDILNTLIRAAAGVLRQEDVRHLGRWYDSEAERVLLAICADYTEAELLRDVFDTLLARSLTIEPSASLVAWVKENYWDKRSEFASAVGVLAYLDKVNKEDIDRVFSSFDKYVKDTDLIDILLDTDHPLITMEVVRRYSTLLGLGTLLDLLEANDPEVRISAVNALKGYNDIGALKLIIDHYEDERDEKVRAVYKENFWVIKQREGGAGARQ